MSTVWIHVLPVPGLNSLLKLTQSRVEGTRHVRWKFVLGGGNFVKQQNTSEFTKNIGDMRKSRSMGISCKKSPSTCISSFDEPLVWEIPWVFFLIQYLSTFLIQYLSTFLNSVPQYFLISVPQYFLNSVPQYFLNSVPPVLFELFYYIVVYDCVETRFFYKGYIWGMGA